MATTVRSASDDLLSHLGPSQRTYPPTATEDSPLPAVLAALNGAMAELATLGPAWCVHTKRSALLRAPTTVAITGSWAVGATSVTIADVASWMLGCSIKFENEPYNEISAISGTTVTLMNPMIAAGSGSATVYCDCITIGTDVLEVLRPVALADQWELVSEAPLPHVDPGSEFSRNPYDTVYRGHYRNRYSNLPQSFSLPSKTPGKPITYFVDKVWAGTGTAAATRLRLIPMPDESDVINYRVRLQPVTWVLTDIYTVATPTVDPNTYIPFEDARIYSVFLPVARYRFAASAVMADNKARAQIEADYKKALAVEAKLAPEVPVARPAFRGIW